MYALKLLSVLNAKSQRFVIKTKIFPPQGSNVVSL